MKMKLHYIFILAVLLNVLYICIYNFNITIIIVDFIIMIIITLLLLIEYLKQKYNNIDFHISYNIKFNKKKKKKKIHKKSSNDEILRLIDDFLKNNKGDE